MKLLRSALVVSLSMLSVSAINITGVFWCDNLEGDVKAEKVVEKVNSIASGTKQNNWYQVVENGVKLQY
ncbi:putative secreted effector protein, partial [Blumeria graminis f. sp. tritici 96224]